MSVVRIQAEILALLSHRAVLSRSGLQIIKIPWDGTHSKQNHPESWEY